MQLLQVLQGAQDADGERTILDPDMQHAQLLGMLKIDDVVHLAALQVELFQVDHARHRGNVHRIQIIAGNVQLLQLAVAMQRLQIAQSVLGHVQPLDVAQIPDRIEDLDAVAAQIQILQVLGMLQALQRCDAGIAGRKPFQFEQLFFRDLFFADVKRTGNDIAKHIILNYDHNKTSHVFSFSILLYSIFPESKMKSAKTSFFQHGP